MIDVLQLTLTSRFLPVKPAGKHLRRRIRNPRYRPTMGRHVQHPLGRRDHRKSTSASTLSTIELTSGTHYDPSVGRWLTSDRSLLPELSGISKNKSQILHRSQCQSRDAFHDYFCVYFEELTSTDRRRFLSH